MKKVRTPLRDLFDGFTTGYFEADTLCDLLILYTRHFYNVYKEVNPEFKKAMQEKAKEYELRYILNCDLQYGYRYDIDYIKPITDSTCFDDFFLVLDWIKNHDWTGCDHEEEHYFEQFMHFATVGREIISEFKFVSYVRMKAEKDVLYHIRRVVKHPIINHINWESWVDYEKSDYQEVKNPFDTSKVMYYEI